MSLALTEAERARLRRSDERRRDGRKPSIDPFDDGWGRFSARSHGKNGVDGASYVDTTHESGHRYVEINSPGYFELIQIRQDPGEWVRDRVSTAAQPLVPLSAIGGDCRSDREDLILAFVAQRPSELRELSWMPADVFTTNRRFEMYDAMLTLRVRGKEITPEATLAVVATRLEDTLARTPWMRRYEVHDASAYLSRLLVTPSDAISAMEAAEKLFADDHRAVLAYQQSKQSSILHPPAFDAARVTAPQPALESRTQVLPLNSLTLLDATPTLQART